MGGGAHCGSDKVFALGGWDDPRMEVYDQLDTCGNQLKAVLEVP